MTHNGVIRWVEMGRDLRNREMVGKMWDFMGIYPKNFNTTSSGLRI